MAEEFAAANYSNGRSPLTKLGKIPYKEWEKAMYGRLMSLGVHRIIKGTDVLPPEPTDTTELAIYLAGLPAAKAALQARSDKAAGEIYQWLDEANKTHVDYCRDEPNLMWDKLKQVHYKSAPNSRFVSLDDLHNIRKEDNESLTDVATRVLSAMQHVKAMRPDKYDIDMLDDELTTMAMIRSLPHAEYGTFTSSLLLLSNLSKDSVLEAFRNEETQRRSRLAQEELAAKAAAARAPPSCYLCNGDHLMTVCPSYEDARELARKAKSNRESGNTGRSNRRGRGRGNKANAANAAATPAGGTGTPDPVNAAAAVCLSANSTSPSADFLWNADTGATASMTPHRNWFSSDYKPHRVPIHLADNKIIYSTGKGSVVFQPPMSPSFLC